MKFQIQILIKTNMPKNKDNLALKLSDFVFILLINVKMPTAVGILTFVSRINYVLSVELSMNFFIATIPVISE